MNAAILSLRPLVLAGFATVALLAPVAGSQALAERPEVQALRQAHGQELALAIADQGNRALKTIRAESRLALRASLKPVALGELAISAAPQPSLGRAAYARRPE